MKNILLCIILLCGCTGFGQKVREKQVLDTIMIGHDSVLVYSDKSWEYLRMIDFDGILNLPLTAITTQLGWKEDWENNVPYTYDNDLSAMKDTIWLCTLDSSHNTFCMPHPGLVTSTFKYRGKRFHYGIDVDLVTGDTLSSMFDGVVRYAKFNDNGFGNLVIVRHYNGLETFYAHLDKLLVTPNQEVKAGDVLGLGGKTGHAYGDHLHFELRFYGNALDPEQIIDFKNQQLKNENLFVHNGLFQYGKSSSNSKTVAVSSSSKGSSSSSSSKSVHIIKSGDSLYAIALKNKTTVTKLCKLNGMKKTDILHTGDRIKLK
jgi:hypothetical protein